MKAIVAVDRAWGIGRDGRLLQPIRADLRRFRELTWGHPVILGRKTLATFPGGRPLKGRRNLVLSRRADFQAEGAEVFSDVEGLLAAAPDDSVVIGGASVYAQLLKFCDLVYVTKIMSTYDADAFFPNLDALPEWKPVQSEPEQEEDGVRFQYVTYRREG